MKRIMITGKGSYIGNALQAYLRRRPDLYAVEALDTVNRAPESYDFHGIDTVVNVAAIVHQKETKALLPLYDRVNRDFAIGLCEKAKTDGAHQFIQCSTMSVYGKNTGVIDADTPLRPVTAYGKSKLEAERGMAPLADDGFAVAILRPPMVLGHGVKGHYRTLERLTDHLFFSPTLENRRTFVSIERLCAYIQARIDDPRSGVFFPQDPTPVSTASLIDGFAAEKGRRLWKTSLFNPAIRLLRLTTTVGKKAFGDLVYENVSELPLSAVFDKEGL